MCHFFLVACITDQNLWLPCLSCLYEGLNMWGISSQPDIRLQFHKTNGGQKAVSRFVLGFCQYVRRCYQLPSESWRAGDRNESAVIMVKGADASPRDKVVLGFPKDKTCFCLTQRWCEESAVPCEVTVFLFLLKDTLEGQARVVWLHKTVRATRFLFHLEIISSAYFKYKKYHLV